MAAVTALQSRIAVVTGASSGLGAAIARALADEGACVVGFARRFSQSALAAVPSPGDIAEIKLDVSDDVAVRARFAELGGLDILINNAGDAAFGSIRELSVADLRAMLDTHIVGAMVCAQQALIAMEARGGGHIVNVSSIAAVQTFAGSAAYSAAKEGMRGFTRVLVEEARPLNVRVTGLYPGAIDTPIWDDKGDFVHKRARMLHPEDVAQLVLDVLKRPALSIEELQVLPPGGSL